jgi:hypothetical protein
VPDMAGWLLLLLRTEVRATGSGLGFTTTAGFDTSSPNTKKVVSGLLELSTSRFDAPCAPFLPFLRPKTPRKPMVLSSRYHWTFVWMVAVGCRRPNTSGVRPRPVKIVAELTFVDWLTALADESGSIDRLNEISIYELLVL